uniref:Glutamate decarboxylase 1 n=1 Tax=Catharus ustulatus TaxID=91951 RepID=A0A8C3UWE0_CATUS
MKQPVTAGTGPLRGEWERESNPFTGRRWGRCRVRTGADLGCFLPSGGERLAPQSLSVAGRALGPGCLGGTSAVVVGDLGSPFPTGAGAGAPRSLERCEPPRLVHLYFSLPKQTLTAGLPTDLLPSKNGEEQTMQFLLEVVDILLNYVRKTFDRSTKVLDFHHPHQLLEGMEGFNLELSDNPESLEQILVDCRDTLKYGVRTGHPRFFNQLSTGLDIIGLAGEWLTSTANTNMFTYEIAPVFVLMEQITLRKMREIIGWSNKDGDGIFSPGGAISNMYSIMAARYKYFPEVKTKGMAAVPKLVLFTSEHSHYSIKKAGAALGFGTDNGYVPLFVNATAGTTVYGAFDPIQEIADICEKYNLWLHVDAAWGGGLLMSRKHRHKLNGIERANSVTWNPHKMMGVLLQCSAILVREKGILQGCNQMCAGYLFQPDKQYDVSYDTGDKAIQCGRHVDIFKFWLMWKAKGTVGFENQINKCLELAEYLYTKIKNREEFEMVFEGEPEHTNVCFWYIPPSLRGMPDSDERREKLHRVAPKIKALMMESGTTMVGYQPQGDKVNFFRMVISNPAATKSDIDFLIEEIERLGQDL